MSSGAPHTAMVVAVECSRLAQDTRGIGRYVRALLPRLVAQRATLRLMPFARRRDELEALRATLESIGVQRDRCEVRLFADLRAGEADLWWYPWNVARPAPRAGTVVATIHDVAPLAHPDPRRTKWWQNRRWRRLYQTTAKRAALLMTISEFSAREIDHYLDVPASRIRVTPLAADDMPVPDARRDAEALDRLGVHAPYVLAVNANDRRKNLALLDGAMPYVADLLPTTTLVMAGPRPSGDTADAPWRHSVGFVSDEDLASLYRSACAVIVPSLYEGFGLPVLEAMRLGAPVICARTSSLPEVAGDAALYVSPTDERQLALAIVQLVTNDTLRDSLRRAGLARAARFSWDETARLTLAAFDDALGR
ncbi:MAG TPA: glycosyltransferase family 1 protein [Gemmatimonadaceae bacterium]|nr:glycosyltransferase family 1 protein [Gemmatimonadaceae bacterium]